MEDRVITKESYLHYCATNEHLIKGEVRAVAVEFPGLDGNSCLSGRYTFDRLENAFASELAECGILLSYVFAGPWSWMNDAAVKMTDGVIGALFDKYVSLPLLLSGGSMGGHGALVYAAYGKYRPSRVAVSCPVCDLTALYPHERFWPSTVYHAFGGEEDYSKALYEHSPLYITNKLPDVPYFIISCEKDAVIAPETHFEPLIKKLIGEGKELTVHRMKDAGHCAHDAEAVHQMVKFLAKYSS